MQGETEAELRSARALVCKGCSYNTLYTLTRVSTRLDNDGEKSQTRPSRAGNENQKNALALSSEPVGGPKGNMQQHALVRTVALPHVHGMSGWVRQKQGFACLP